MFNIKINWKNKNKIIEFKSILRRCFAVLKKHVDTCKDMLSRKIAFKYNINYLKLDGPRHTSLRTFDPIIIKTLVKILELLLLLLFKCLNCSLVDQMLESKTKLVVHLEIFLIWYIERLCHFTFMEKEKSMIWLIIDYFKCYKNQEVEYAVELKKMIKHNVDGDDHVRCFRIWGLNFDKLLTTKNNWFVVRK